MKSFLWALSVLLIGLGLPPEDLPQESLYHEAHFQLRSENPTASEECVMMAANIMIGNYEAIEHKMYTKDGRCATTILGLLVRVDVNGNIR